MTCFAPIGADPLCALADEQAVAYVSPGVRGPLNPMMPEFAGVGNGIHPDSAAVLACYDTLVEQYGSGTIEWTERHALLAPLVVTHPNVEIVFRGRGRALGLGSTSWDGLIIAKGCWVSLPASLAANGAAGSRRLTFAELPDVEPGDLVHLVASVAGIHPSYAYNHGFVAPVAAISGKTVIFEWALPFALKTTDSYYFLKLLPLRGFRLDGFRGARGLSTAPTLRGVLVQYAEGAVIDGVETEDFPSAGTMLTSLYGGRIGGIRSLRDSQAGQEFSVVLARVTAAELGGIQSARSAYGGVILYYCHHNSGGLIRVGTPATRGLELYASCLNTLSASVSGPGFDCVSIQQNTCDNVLMLATSAAETGTSDRRGVKDNGEHNDGNRIVYVSRGNLDGDTINNGYSTGNATLPAA